MAKIQVFFGGVLQAEHALDDKMQLTVGRGPECDIVIDNLGVSRTHCTLKDIKRQWVVEDNDSSNGTFVNGERVTSRILEHQDRVVVGKHTLLFDRFGRSDAGGGIPEEALREPPEDDAAGRTMFVAGDALARFQQRSEKEKGMALVLEGRPRVTLSLSKDATTIGKAPQCDLHISGWLVRGEQLRVIRQRSYYKVVDLGGWRALRVNGAKVREAVLRAGDVLSIAGNQIRFGSL